jgi:hypothetical protein
VVTALAIVIGGAVAYRRLLHTRPFTPLARLKLEGKLVTIGVARQRALHVKVGVQNAGSTHLLLDVCYEPRLRVVTPPPQAWREAVTGTNGDHPRELRWDGGRACNIAWLGEQGCGETVRELMAGPLNEFALPPAAELRKEFIIPVAGSSHAYLLLLTVIACQHSGPRWFRAMRHRHSCTKDIPGA